VWHRITFRPNYAPRVGRWPLKLIATSFVRVADNTSSLRLAIVAPSQALPEKSRCMRERTTASDGIPGARDFATIIAISIVAFAIANLLHEGAGHGGACLLTGGHAKALSSVHFDCTRDSRFVSAGGTLVNVIAGLLCWIAIRFLRHASGHLQYFV